MPGLVSPLEDLASSLTFALRSGDILCLSPLWPVASPVGWGMLARHAHQGGNSDS